MREIGKPTHNIWIANCPRKNFIEKGRLSEVSGNTINVMKR
jgi:hypothetical protein